MKNLTKIFMAVVAGMFAFSCVTDTTVDQGVQLGNEANGVVKTVLSVGIADSEELRTQLGEAGSHGYPMYWSNGDKISVNGVESNELVLGEEEKVNVTDFTFKETLSTPYCVTYPAAAEGQVEFKAYQSHAGNTTFGDNVATMWGYGENGEGVSLKHLTGVIKIGVVVDGALGEKNLVYAQVSTIDRTPIAGAFNFDFENGVLGEPTETASEVINYSFGEGAALSTTEPTYLHLAVPAGKYDELYVTLYDNDGGVMYATVKAGDNNKPLAAGKVREFKKDGAEQLITYAPNAEVFVVREANDLVKLSEKMAEAKAESTVFTKDILFVNDVDMTGVEWTPLTLDTRRTVDSKPVVSTIHGNGYAIKNLKAPLFNYLYASVKGLHLKNVNIKETVDPCVGTFARRLGSGTSAYPLVVENCTVTGSIEVNCPNKELIAGDYSSYSTGGICGTAYAATLQNLISDVDITIKQVVSSDAFDSTKNGIQPCIAGIVGNSGKGGAYNTHFINLENRGDITVTDCSWTSVPTIDTGSGATSKGTIGVYLGGLIGSSAGTNGTATFRNLTNRGNITLNGGNYAHVRMGGIGASIHTNLKDGTTMTSTGNCGENFNNYGEITVENCSIRLLYLGGAIGYSAFGSAWKEVHTHKSASVNVKESAYCLSVLAGGAMGWNEHNVTVSSLLDYGYVINSSNAASVTVKCTTVGEHENTGEVFYRIGGFSAWTQSYMENCSNSGDVHCEANLFYNRAGEHMCCVGGVVGYRTYGHSTGITNSGNVSAKINITNGTNATNDQATANLGGVFAYASSNFKNCENTGDVFFKGGEVGGAKLGGVAARAGASACHNSTNSGDIHFGEAGAETKTRSHLYIGGCAAITNTTNDSTNSGSVYINDGVTVGGKALIGGVIGDTYTSETDAWILRAKSTSGASVNIANNVTFSNTALIGGVIGRNNTKFKISGFVNEGCDVNVGTATFVNEVYLGGVLGYNNASYASHFTNKGNITFNGTITAVEGDAQSGALHLGGVVGRSLYSINDTMSLTNGEEGTAKGAITVGGSIAGFACIGGTTGSCVNSQTSLCNGTNYGKITVTPVVYAKETYVGGIIGFAESPRQEFTWYTDTTAGSFTKGATAALQHTLGGDKRTYLKNCNNYGALEFTGNANCGSLMLGGVAGMSSGNFETVNNYGTVTVKGTLGTKGVRLFEISSSPHLIGGVVGAAICGFSKASNLTATWQKVYNHAEVKLDNVTYSTRPYIGGVVGWAVEYNHYAPTEGKSNSKSTKTSLEVDIDNVENKGPVTVVNAAGSTEMWVGGVGGYLGGYTTNTVNSGKISVHHKSSTSHLRLGGIAYQIKDYSTDVTNNGDIEITGKVGTGTSGTLYAGGFIGNKNNYERIRCNNNGDIYIGTEATGCAIAGNCFVGGMMYDGADSYTQTLTDCHNTGDITLSSNSTVVYSCLLAGLVAKVENTGATSVLYINGCSNSGNMTVKGTVNDCVELAGMVSRVTSGAVLLGANGFVNSGTMEHAGTASKSTTGAQVYIGGCIAKMNTQTKKVDDVDVTYSGALGHATASIKKWLGTAKNTGKLIHSGKCNAGVIIGGLFGYTSSVSDNNEFVLPTTATYINEGDLSITGTYNAASTWNCIGGIYGNTNRNASNKQLILKNATANCKITALGLSSLGMLMGCTRTANRYATNCQVAGSIDKGENSPYQNEFDEEITGWHSSPKPLSASNYFEYIYSSAVTKEVAEGDSCSFYVAPTTDK